ncbi:C4-dicarboxylic acid transporter DauA [Gynuella sunshinyii]|uniref:Sulfate permease and related transporter (MFS superfamily) n=1 Tax=Gynuella sunshinyii YC6258 TaxID=1445510 RepID=A0A0C5VSL0_9GAMM|nr:C4-dicarboxylic acid transporter DauA [Gynuella sunshinyii]AJQ93244.1 sulfate permease and related transporter (MFS superfamily) [Gynuella sunshinyii YC6258]
MPHRAHLFSLRVAHAFRDACITEKYSSQRLIKDTLAGITVGIIAIPLSMALAIASGVPPQHGLYTAIIAGFIIALTGGSRFSISGPTAAFVVILAPIAHSQGLSGLLMASVMSGVLLLIMAYMRLGRFIEYIPESVTLGFTGGIAVSIATLQLKDFFGLTTGPMPEHYLEKVVTLAQALPTTHWPSLLVASLTLVTMILWPRLKIAIPAHLPAAILSSLFALALNHYQLEVDTIGSRFSYLLPNGDTGFGIPPYLPTFEWPWLQAGAEGHSSGLSFARIIELLPSAFAIAMLGAIESLLCAVVLDGMTGRRHSANSELLGQGIGNIIAPFFGGITATAAIARSAANVRAGSTSPVSAMLHAIVVLLGLVSLAPMLAYLPMPAMAALLVMVAWNMSEAHKSKHLIKTATRSDIWVFLTCFSLTVMFDMVIAITTGILLAALLFMKEIADMTKVTEITDNKRLINDPLPEGWRVYKINGPLFFAPAERIFGELALLSENARGIIIYLDGVPILDAGGVSAMNKLIEKFRRDQGCVWFADFQFQPLKTLARAKVKPIEGTSRYFSTLQDALTELNQINS